MKQELIITRLSHRLGVRQETIWARLGELRTERRRQEERARRAEQERRQAPVLVNQPTQVGLSALPGPISGPGPVSKPAAGKSGPPPAAERQLLQMLLAEPELVLLACSQIAASEVTHSGLRRLLEELYALQEAGQTADLDGLRIRLLDRPDLVTVAHDLQFVGRHTQDRAVHLQRLLGEFARKRDEHSRDELRRQLQQTAGDDDEAQKELLRRLTSGK
jgi:DNA primase